MLVPVRASPVPRVVRRSFLVKFSPRLGGRFHRRRTHMYMPCAAYCNSYTCNEPDCLSCGPPPAVRGADICPNRPRNWVPPPLHCYGEHSHRSGSHNPATTGA